MYGIIRFSLLSLECGLGLKCQAEELNLKRRLQVVGAYFAKLQAGRTRLLISHVKKYIQKTSILRNEARRNACGKIAIVDSAVPVAAKRVVISGPETLD